MKQKIKDFWNVYKTKKTTWLVLAVIVIAAFVILKKGADPVSLDVATASRTDVTDAVVLSGRSQSASAVKLGFADQGRVSSVSASEGDRVSAGQVLARLESSDLQASLKNAEASLLIAKAGLANNGVNLEKVKGYQDSLVENAYRSLLSQGLEAVPESTNTSAPAPVITGDYSGPEGYYVVTAYSSGATSGASFTVSGLENGFVGEVSANTSVPLGSRGLFIRFGAGTSYPGTSWKISVPNVRSSVYTANLNAYNVAKAARDQAISTAQAELVSANSDDSIAQARVMQAQAAIDSILSQIGRRRIAAPFDGVVANVDIKPGQTTTGISSGTSGESSGSTITLISENDYEVMLKVPEISVSKISVGQEVSIALDAYGPSESFPGKVVSINPAETIVDGVPVYETKVSFTKPDPRIRSGMTATATIVANHRTGVVAVPASFIHSDKEGSYVNLLVSDDRTERRAVATGLRGSDSMVEITSGLDEGQKVRVDALK